MFYLACISFNNITYNENICYRNKCNKKVIYGSMLKIREIYPKESLIFIAEMNINENKIEGIGLIKNVLVYNRTHKIHDNSECNRFIYQGKYWLSRTQILDVDFEILNIFDDILFKGKSHLKNRIGIRILTDNLFIHWVYDLITLKNKVKNVFLHYFQKKEKKEEEYFEIIPKIKKLVKQKEEIENTQKRKEEQQKEEEEEYFEIVPKIKKKEEIENTKKRTEEQKKEQQKKEQEEEEYFEIVPNIKINKKNIKI